MRKDPDGEMRLAGPVLTFVLRVDVVSVEEERYGVTDETPHPATTLDTRNQHEFLARSVAHPLPRLGGQLAQG